MKRGLMVMVGVVAVALAAAGGVLAAQATQDAKQKTMQLTGCLAKGTDAGSFVLNDATPATTGKEETKTAAKAETKSYHLMPKDTVKLDAHVGHRIEVTVEEAAGTAKPATTTGTSGKAGDMPHVTVTAMKHIAPKCQ
jgi:hypothetical protein